VRPEGVRRICAQLLAGAQTCRLAVAETAEEREAVYRLRYECLIERGWARASDFPDGLERDEYDADALHLAAWVGPHLVGAVRMVTPVADRRLPIEAAFDLALEPRGEVVDGGRLVIAPLYRGDGAHRLLALLFARFWMEADRRGFAHIAAAAPRSAIALYRRVGLDVQILGAPRLHWGEERLPLLLSAGPGAFSAARRDTSGIARRAR
jgi:N-acyl-L-homoserine lactone synthetase